MTEKAATLAAQRAMQSRLFTVIFAIGRMPGWIAHWKEQHDAPGGRIVRPRQVYTGPTETNYVPIEER